MRTKPAYCPTSIPESDTTQHTTNSTGQGRGLRRVSRSLSTMIVEHNGIRLKACSADA